MLIEIPVQAVYLIPRDDPTGVLKSSERVLPVRRDLINASRGLNVNKCIYHIKIHVHCLSHKI